MLHAWVSSGLALAPLRVFFQAAGEGEAEDEEGAVALSTHRRSSCCSCRWKALPELLWRFPNRHCPGCGSSWFLPLDFPLSSAEHGLGLLCPFPGGTGSCCSLSYPMGMCPSGLAWPCQEGWLVTRGGTVGDPARGGGPRLALASVGSCW